MAQFYVGQVVRLTHIDKKDPNNIGIYPEMLNNVGKEGIVMDTGVFFTWVDFGENLLSYPKGFAYDNDWLVVVVDGAEETSSSSSAPARWSVADFRMDRKFFWDE